MGYRINRLTRSMERRKGANVDSTWRQRLNLKRAVQPQMNTDGHGFAAYYATIYSMKPEAQKTARAFHAKDDHAEIRSKVFEKPMDIGFADPKTMKHTA